MERGNYLVDSGDGTLHTQELPASVKYVDNGGILVLEETMLDNGRITCIKGKLPYDLSAPKDWTEEEVSKLPDFVYYISNVDGGYIGSDRDYKFLVEEKELILIQKVEDSDNACSIGYQPRENKWYGWSHRAIQGFTIGDVVKENDLTTTSGYVEEYRIQHPDEDMSLPVGFKAITLKDAKRMAIAFANAVS